ncbi:LAETG motif-containing sortase-dependent surface protein [Kitasatospora aburaviensis]
MEGRRAVQPVLHAGEPRRLQDRQGCEAHPPGAHQGDRQGPQRRLLRRAARHLRDHPQQERAGQHPDQRLPRVLRRPPGRRPLQGLRRGSVHHRQGLRLHLAGGGPHLAETGSSSNTLPIAVGGAAVLAAGAGTLVVLRRRKAGSHS